jgi:hypothetical protein
MLATADATAASYATRALGCKGNVCLNASFSASTLKISASYNGSLGQTYTHFNYRSDCFGGQRDVDRGRVMSIGVPEGRKSCSVSAQWCSRGGVGYRSVCGDWQTWDVLTPQENVKVVTKCADGICVRVRIDGNFAKLGLTKYPRSTHRNIRYPVGNTVKQTEGNSVDFHLHEGHATVLVQTCNRGGPLEHSSCTSWTTFQIP